jgi:AmiR/NasT family two-component response regulator
MKGDEEKIFQAGCIGYIPKPIDTRQFSHMVESVLSRSHV